MSEQERICTKCQKSYFGDEERCPEDNGELVTVGRSAEDRAGQTIGDKVTILRLLGKGGMGAVYRALQHSMEREVAVKLLHKSFSDDATVVRRFLQEAKSASKLNHPNVITLFDFGQTDDGELYLMMELLEGEELGEILENEAPLSAERSLDIVGQVCDALQHAHDAGLVHRDIKPDNIFVLHGARRNRDFVKVLDFGIAKVKSVEGTASGLTRTGMVCGTPAYMSPEQAMGEEVDARSDVYSVGVMLYEMLSGVRPFDGDTPVKLLMSHVTKEPPPLREARPGIQVPAALERVVMLTLAKNPDRRPASAAQLVDDLQAALDEHEKRPETVDLPPFDVRTGVDISGMEAALPEDDPGGPGLADDPDSSGVGLADTAMAMETPVGLIPVYDKTVPTNTDTGVVPVTLPEAKARPEPEIQGLTSEATAIATPSNGRWLAIAAAILVVGVGAWIALGSNSKKSDPVEGGVATANAQAGEPTTEPAAPEPPATQKTAPRPAAKPAAAPPVAKAVAAGAERRISENERERPVEKKPEPPKPEAPAAAVPEPPMPEAPRPEPPKPVRLETVPPGGVVYLGDAKHGTAPVDLPRPMAGMVLPVKVKLRGYKTQSLMIKADAEPTLVVKLRKKARKKPTSSGAGGGFIE